jgi:hypothetical protein
MAIDNTPPRLKLIVTIAVITVITLVGINFVLDSYYAMMTDQAHREKSAPTAEKEAQHKAELAALTNATIPINKAMAEIAKGERPALIAPQQSEDLGPMTGWSKLPKPAPTPHPRVEAPPPAADADGGAALAGDAGASMLAGDAGVQAAGDAGAPAAPGVDAGGHGHH